jgi:HAD superfamily hydrolase (TIGR01509 family)
MTLRIERAGFGARPRSARIRSVNAVCFDLDGVLVDTMPLHAQAWLEACRHRSLRVSRLEIYTWEGEPGMVTATRLLARQGRPATRGAIDGLLADKERRFIRLARRIRVIPRLARLVRWLASQHLRLALVTGTSSGEVRRIVPAGLRSAFDVIVTGDQVRHGKPRPEPYRTAMRKLRVRPSEAIVVENAPNGIRSARLSGAGLIIALTSSLPRAFLRDAHGIVNSAGGLEAVLQRLARRRHR